MLLFYRGDMENHLLLELVGGSLHAKAFSEEAELEVTFPRLASDGDWRDAEVWLSEEEGLLLIVKGPGCHAEGCTVEDGGPEGPYFHPSETFNHEIGRAHV